MAQENLYQQIVKKDSLLDYLNQEVSKHDSHFDIENAMSRFLDSRARERGIPLHGTFELTPLCNLDCKMCYVHLNQEQLQKSGHTLLDSTHWIDIMSQAIENGMINALLTGGEALSYPGFDDIYLYLLSRGVNVSVNTNGLLLSEKRIHFFKKYRPKTIQITLYGGDDETYEKVTGHRVYSKVKAAINAVIKESLPLNIGITPNKYMLGNGRSIISQMESLGVPYTINASLFTPRHNTGRETFSHDISLEDYIDLYRIRAELQKREVVSIPASHIRTVGSNNSKPSFGLKCAAGRSSFAVLWNGIMQACLMLNDYQYNLTEYTFVEAWKYINESVNNYPFPSECVDCSYRLVCPTCVVIHAQGAPKGHVNPVFCKRAQRLAQEGFIKLDSNCN